MTVTADTSSLDRFADELEASGRRSAGKLLAAVSEAAGVGVRVAKAYAPVLQDRGRAPHRRPGELRDSITSRTVGVSGRAGISAEMVAGAFYARFVEYGTARTRPVPFMAKGRDAAEPVLIAAATKAAVEAMPK